MMRAILNRSVMFAMMLTASFVLWGCDDYGQDTPEQTIKTAKMLVETGRADKLGNLIYAENDQWRKLMRRTGIFLGNMQKLGTSLEEKFPKQVGELRDRAKQAAAEGKSTSLLGTFTRQAMSGNRRKRPSEKERQEMEQAFNDGVKRIFADPYGWLRESENRLTAEMLNDNTAALLWDGKPILAPLGMVMKKDDRDNWCFVLPTNIPGLSQFMPKTDKEFKLWGSIIATFDNVAIDLTKDVQEGRLTSFDSVAAKAGEKAFIPAAMTFAAYGAYVEAKKKETAAAKTESPK